jgi:hypothetical protein
MKKNMDWNQHKKNVVGVNRFLFQPATATNSISKTPFPDSKG